CCAGGHRCLLGFGPPPQDRRAGRRPPGAKVTGARDQRRAGWLPWRTGARLGRVSTPPPVDQATLDLAVRLVQEAGDRTLRWFRRDDLEVIRKEDGTPVTAADRDAERFLREQLAEHFPGDGVLGEEEAPTHSTTGRRWILDPIDGTKAFTCGVPLYSNLLALEDEHGLALGIINLPALGETVWAGRGLGCWSERGPARVSDHAGLDGAYVMASSLTHWPGDSVARLDRAGAVAGGPAAPGAAGGPARARRGRGRAGGGPPGGGRRPGQRGGGGRRGRRRRGGAGAGRGRARRHHREGLVQCGVEGAG